MPTIRRFLNYLKLHWKQYILGFVIGGIAIVIYAQATKEPEGTSTVLVKRGNLTESFSANGKIKAKKVADLKFNAPAKVAWISVKEGDKVAKGRGIAQLDAISLNAVYQNTLNDLRNYQANAEMVLDSVQKHDTDETFTQKAARTAAEVSRDNAYNLTLATSQALKNATIVTPFAGTVVDTNDIVAGVNLSGADLENKFIRIVDLESLFFAADVDEVDYSKLALKQEVLVTLDAFPGDSCIGRVVKIGKDGQETAGGVITIPVEVDLENCDLNLAMDLNGEANFITNKVENVLVIPKKYLVKENDRDYVWKQIGTDTRNRQKVLVTTGLESLSDIEVKSGLSENDKIVYVP